MSPANESPPSKQRRKISQIEDTQEKLLAEKQALKNRLDQVEEALVKCTQEKDAIEKNPQLLEEAIADVESQLRLLLKMKREINETLRKMTHSINELYRIAIEEDQAAQPRCDAENRHIVLGFEKKEDLRKQYNTLCLRHDHYLLARANLSSQPATTSLARHPSLLWSQASSLESANTSANSNQSASFVNDATFN